MPSLPTMNRRKQCKYILSKEICPFGKRCRFLHQREGEPSDCEKLKSMVCEVEGIQLKDGGDKHGDLQEQNHIEEVDHHSNEKQLSHKPDQSQDSKQQKKCTKVTRVCRFYLEQRGCRFGEKCKFIHPSRGAVIRKEEKSLPLRQDQTQLVESDHRGAAGGKGGKAPPPRRNQARLVESDHRGAASGKGEKAPPLRRNQVQLVESDSRGAVTRKEEKESLLRQNQTQPVGSVKGNQQHPPPLTLASFIGSRPYVQRPRKVDHKSVDSLREVELEQLQARFPGDNCNLLTKSKEKISYLVKFQPTDQDWNGPAVLPLEVTFPSNYPDDYCQVKLASQELASDVVACGNQAIKNYWNPTMLHQLMFRPFLSWWDKSLVEILQTPFTMGSNANSNKDTISDNSSESSVEDIEEQSLNLPPQIKSKQGTEIRLVGLDLSQTLGTAFWPTLKIVISCQRCKNHQEIEVKEERLYSMTCGRCSSNMCILYHLALIHLSSSTLGYVELTRCTPVDVIFQFSSLAITCLSCSNEVISQGFSIGQPKDVYCHRCHNKITLSATGIKFLQHQQAGDVSGKKADVVYVHLSSKKVVESNLKDGEPLPEYGICQHYKKSHRWLRFPCCGRAFPCDICHDSTQDHPMEFATRMICGYCSKEQGYTGKGDCVRCGADLISSKHSAHWEGGQGCRNKSKMSRLDKQKYRNSDVKTVCKKAERVGKK